MLDRNIRTTALFSKTQKVGMSYFILRGTTVKGPFSQAKLKALVQENKLKKSDSISESADGPWEPLDTAYRRIRQSAQSRTLPTIPTIDDWSVKRGLLGKYKINFVCPQCSTELNSDESDIGQKDYCPQCRFYFVLSSSVAEDISSDRKRRSKEKEKKSEEKQQRQIERQQEGKRKQQLKEDQRRQAEQLRLEELTRQQKLEEELAEAQKAAEEQRVARQAADRDEFLAYRKQLPESAQVWLSRAEQEEYWVRKDFYHLRAYVEAYCAGEPEFSGVGQPHVDEADAHDNFKAAGRSCWYALYLTAEAKFGTSSKARRSFEKTGTTDIWDGMSCYALEALYYLLADKYSKHADAAAQEYEQRHRHNAWLCSNYYTLRAIIVLMAGPLADTPRYVAYFENIESEYTVWQALMSRTIELFVEVNIFATEARK